MTPSLVLTDYNILGRRIPKDLIAETRERFKQLESDGMHPWRILVDEVMLEEERTELPEVEQKLAEDRLWIAQACAEVMLENIGYRKTADDLYWKERLEQLIIPEDFLQFWFLLNVPEIAWRNSEWLGKISKLPIDAGGINLTLGGLSKALNNRFGSHPQFVAWMDGKDKPDLKPLEIVCAWQTPADALVYFKSINVLSEQWRSSRWMAQIAKLPMDVGGINTSLATISKKIHIRFGSYPQFVAWMDGKDKPDLKPKNIVKGWKFPVNALDYFTSINIPNDRWRSSDWMAQVAKLPIHEGGINTSLANLSKTIKNRFGSYPQFVAWMDGKDKPDLKPLEIVCAWQTPADALAYFESINVLNEEWRSSEWMGKIAKLPMDVGGIGLSLARTCHVIKNRFGSHFIFVAAMDGHIPFNGFSSAKEAQSCLRQEVLRLRAGSKWIQEPTADNCITQAEWNEIAQEAWYKKNAVVKVVTNYLHSQELES